MGWSMDNDVFTIKDLVKMIMDLQRELAKTQTLIKNYNGLREKQTEYESKHDELCLRVKTVEDCLDGKKENKKNYQWGLSWIVGLVGMITALISLILR